MKLLLFALNNVADTNLLTFSVFSPVFPLALIVSNFKDFFSQKKLFSQSREMSPYTLSSY